jgi:hypothetical protein
MTTTTRSSIVTRASALAGLSAATLALAAAFAAAQAPGPGPGRMGVQVTVGGPAIGTGGGPVSLITLVTQASVQKELELTDAQKQKITKLDGQLKDKTDQVRSAMAPKPDQGGGPLMMNPELARAGMEQTKQAIQNLHAEADAVVMRELQRKQRVRLDQIKLQADGPLAFERPDVLERLNLQDAQIELIQAILEDGRAQMEPTGGGLFMRDGAAMPGPGLGPGRGAGAGKGAGAGPGAGAGAGGAPPSPEDLKKKYAGKEFQDQVKAQFEKRRKERQAVRDQMMQAIGKVLTRGQRATYNKMVGEPFDLKPFQNAAPNIAVTTFDGSGAGPGDASNAAAPKSDPAPTASKNKAARPKRSR